MLGKSSQVIIMSKSISFQSGSVCSDSLMDPLCLEHRCVLVIASAPCSAHSAEINQVEAPCSGCYVQAPSSEAADTDTGHGNSSAARHTLLSSLSKQWPRHARTRPLSSANPVSLCSRRRLRSSAEYMWALARSATHRSRYRLQQLAPRGLASGPTYLASHLLCLPELLPGALLRDRPALCCGAAAATGHYIDLMTQNSPHQPVNPACASAAI